ncbi:pancreatic triacylglycerol lipase [Halyomorpha halys]|uniref:pancreatic triacylglycerol lipase n=1 Tax=Halyomorpha halys TaxID=286706 RepID=UPI0006D4E2AA|nr:pancreatic triacylglycerol lipase-like [Halyomorpha halys]
MEWVLTTLLFLLGFLENARATNFMLLAYKDELKSISTRRMLTSSQDLSQNVLFYLQVRCKKEDPCEGSEIKEKLIPNDVGILQSSYFDPNRPTKIIIHGFLSNSNKPVAQLMKNSLLEHEDVNVILVDWGKISSGIDYNSIAKRTTDVGAYVAEFIDFLVENGAQLDDIHLIGHSLGAHVAGFAGAGVKSGKVARITGLDPAKPGFYRVPIEKRLNTDSAKFVDCIHTCVGMLGLTEAICTADFYPNAGKNMQPGCPFYDFGRCSHVRSYEYFAESIDPNHKFLMETCPSLPVHSHEKCVPSSVEMGYHTPSSVKGIFYGTTNNKSPFAVVTRRK